MIYGFYNKMNKVFIKIFAILLVVLLSFNTFACGNNESSNNGGGNNAGGGGAPAKEKEIEELDEEVFILKNGRSDYKVVIPSTSTRDEQLASSELTYLFKEGTGYSLPEISDVGLTFDEQSKYISLGKTSLARQAGCPTDVGECGYIIKTIGNSIFIYGDDNYGTTYGVYEFLNIALGMNIFAADEISFDFNHNVELYNIYVKDEPDYKMRSIGYLSLTEDALFEKRMRCDGRGNANWAIWGHTYTGHIIKPEDYLETHPDWFSSDGIYLCLSNEEMKAEFIKNVEKYLDQSPEALYVGLTQPDDTSFCYCDKCRENIRKYGTEGGLNLHFINDVAREVNAWLEVKYPGREVKYLTFAYHATEAAPVTTDASGNKKPIVTADDSVVVELCLPGMIYSDGFTDRVNSQYYEKIKSWALCAKNLSIYSYCINFWNYFIPFNNYSGLEKIYREAYQSGAYSLHENGPLAAKTSGFEEMRIYIQTQLLWDTSLHYDDLVNKFMQGYYGPAATAMRKYYDFHRAYYEVLKTYKNVTSTIYFPLENRQYWDKSYLNKCGEILGEAYSAIAELKTTDREKYDKLYKRIMKEQLCLDYLNIQLYSSAYSKTELAEMISNFKYYANIWDLRCYREGISVDNIYDEWNKKL